MMKQYHPKHNRKDVDVGLSYANKHQLYITGGSDYHGRYYDGEVIGQCYVNEYLKME